MTTLADLWESHHSGPLPEFEPVARYIAPMDCLIYLREDCSYRAVRLNAHITVLLHPYEDRPVGIKLKGMRYLHERLKAILRGTTSSDSVPSEIRLIAYWELALTATAEIEIERAESERQRQLAERVREIIEDAGPVAAEELPQAEAA